MKITNAALANAKLAIGGQEVTGDENGVFDLPEKDAKALLATPGWSQPKAAKALSPEPEPVSEPDAPPDDESEEIDLDAMTKAELTALAEEHGIELDGRANKEQIKTAIEDALGGGD